MASGDVNPCSVLSLPLFKLFIVFLLYHHLIFYKNVHATSCLWCSFSVMATVETWCDVVWNSCWSGPLRRERRSLQSSDRQGNSDWHEQTTGWRQWQDRRRGNWKVGWIGNTWTEHSGTGDWGMEEPGSGGTTGTYISGAESSTTDTQIFNSLYHLRYRGNQRLPRNTRLGNWRRCRNCRIWNHQKLRIR